MNVKARKSCCVINIVTRLGEIELFNSTVSLEGSANRCNIQYRGASFVPFNNYDALFSNELEFCRKRP